MSGVASEIRRSIERFGHSDTRTPVRIRTFRTKPDISDGGERGTESPPARLCRSLKNALPASSSAVVQPLAMCISSVNRRLEGIDGGYVSVFSQDRRLTRLRMRAKLQQQLQSPRSDDAKTVRSNQRAWSLCPSCIAVVRVAPDARQHRCARCGASFRPITSSARRSAQSPSYGLHNAFNATRGPA